MITLLINWFLHNHSYSNIRPYFRMVPELNGLNDEAKLVFTAKNIIQI